MNAIDQQFYELQQHILSQDTMKLLSKHNQIRVRAWIKKLSLITNNQIWRKNRNNYIKILYAMTLEGQLVGPFNLMPPENNLPKLQEHQINNIISSIGRNKKLEKKKQNHNIFPNSFNSQQILSQIKEDQNQEDPMSTYTQIYNNYPMPFVKNQKQNNHSLPYFCNNRPKQQIQQKQIPLKNHHTGKTQTDILKDNDGFNCIENSDNIKRAQNLQNIDHFLLILKSFRFLQKHHGLFSKDIEYDKIYKQADKFVSHHQLSDSVKCEFSSSSIEHINVYTEEDQFKTFDDLQQET